MTPYSEIYKAFLAKVLDDEWGNNWSYEDTEEDLHQIFESALPYFKFPKFSLEQTEDGFVDDLTQQEVQIIATYMKCEWLNRSIMTWENIKPLYSEKDFSQANLLDKLNQTLVFEQDKAKKLESIYYRSRSGKGFDFSSLAGNE